MSKEKCPYCGSTNRMWRYNKWHIKERYCGDCYRSLNSEEVWRRTRMAEIAAKEGKLNEFHMGQYTPEIPEDETYTPPTEDVDDLEEIEE